MLTSKKIIISLSLITLLASACTTSANDPVINNSVKTPGSLSVSATTTTYNGTFAPRHVLAIWVESSSGTFVKTLLEDGRQRQYYLSNWYNATTSGSTIDAITDATLSSHGTKTCTWNGKDVGENVVGDGSYQICMEFTEHDGTGKFARFTFTKGTTASTLTPAGQSNFSAVSLKWTPQ
jgi:hypothetical protein